MERPYPDNGGFYGMGCLREMGLRKSRHVGDFRTKSEFLNKEEGFRQPLRGHETILERGIVLRNTGGLRKPLEASDSAARDSLQPSTAPIPEEVNLAIIR